MSAAANIVRLPVRPKADPDAELLAAMVKRDELRRDLAALDESIAAGVRAYSYARGFRVPLRPEQVRREIESPKP